MIVAKGCVINIDSETVSIWVSAILPLIIADATIGRPFNQIFDLKHRVVSVASSAVIVNAESEPTGTTFTLSVA